MKIALAILVLATSLAGLYAFHYISERESGHTIRWNQASVRLGRVSQVAARATTFGGLLAAIILQRNTAEVAIQGALCAVSWFLYALPVLIKQRAPSRPNRSLIYSGLINVILVHYSGIVLLIG